jgi:dienelactone hydrolase
VPPRRVKVELVTTSVAPPPGNVQHLFNTDLRGQSVNRVDGRDPFLRAFATADKIGAMARFDPAQPLVHPLPDPERVEVRPDLVYAHAGGRALAMDLYLPRPRAAGTRVPAVLLVHGEADPELLLGVRGWGQYTGWGRLLAGQGLAGVAFEHRAILDAGFGPVVAEVNQALAAVGERAADLGIDPGRVGVAAFSAGVPLTAAVLAGAAERVRCAALCYGPLSDLAPDPALPPLLVVRAGRDDPGLNRTIDDFVAAAEQRGLPVELVHQPDGGHGFDVADDSDASREVIERVVAFLRGHLGT